MRSWFHSGGQLARNRQRGLDLSDHGSQVALRCRADLDISPLSAGVIRLQPEPTRLDAIRIANRNRSGCTALRGSAGSKITLKGQELDVIPLLCEYAGRY